jgi:hypothetical protein
MCIDSKLWPACLKFISSIHQILTATQILRLFIECYHNEHRKYEGITVDKM